MKLYAEKDQALEVGDKISFDSITYFCITKLTRYMV
ncbi:MAG: hypothetical protein CM15mV141_180 [uncultured marine virus]|nr:MAG: hypothetical protein CM15mV141_180 [uncultured marine virus]